VKLGDTLTTRAIPERLWFSYEEALYQVSSTYLCLDLRPFDIIDYTFRLLVYRRAGL